MQSTDSPWGRSHTALSFGPAAPPPPPLPPQWAPQGALTAPPLPPPPPLAQITEGKPHKVTCSCPACNTIRGLIIESGLTIPEAITEVRARNKARGQVVKRLDGKMAAPTVVETCPEGGFVVGVARKLHKPKCPCPNCNKLRKLLKETDVPVQVIEGIALQSLQKGPDIKFNEELRRKRIAKANRGKVRVRAFFFWGGGG